MHALRLILLRFLKAEGNVFGEDGGRVETEVVLLGKFESGEVEVILRVVWLGKGSVLRVLLLTVVMALLGLLLFEGFGVSLGQVLGVAEQFGVHLNQIILTALIIFIISRISLLSSPEDDRATTCPAAFVLPPPQMPIIWLLWSAPCSFGCC
jgi:hypothetical protein